MAQLKDIKERINSVKKTRKMTQAMKMVAAAKFKRLSKKAVSSRQVLTETDYALNQVSENIDDSSNIKYLRSFKTGKELILIVAGDKGLCGGFNSNVLKYVSQYIETSRLESEIMLFGKKAIQYFQKKGLVIVSQYEQFQDSLTVDSIDDLLNVVLSEYSTEKYEKIRLIYNEFKSAVSTNLINKQLLPIQWSEADEEVKVEDIIIEPDITSVFNSLSQSYIKYSLFNAFLESSAAEQGARMAAMDAATDNAGGMIQDLSLIYNRQRQAQITTELTEIVAGAEAL